MKSTKDQSLKDLVRPLHVVVEDPNIDHASFHHSLTTLQVTVDFYDNWSEGRVDAAFKLLNLSTPADSIACESDADFNSRLVDAIDYATHRAEVVIIGRARAAKADKKSFHTSVLALYKAIKSIVPLLPQMYMDIQCKHYEEGLRNRAERLKPQAQAIETLTLAVLAEQEPLSFQAPWPSEVRAALATLQDTPPTSLARAFESWAGARLIISKTHMIQQRSAHDNMALASSTNTCEGAMKTTGDDHNIDVLVSKLGSFTSSLTVLAQHVQKVSPSGFEECAPSLKQVLEHMSKSASVMNDSMWHKVMVDAGSSLQKLFDACADHQNMAELTSEQRAHAASMQRSLNFLSKAMPAWLQTFDNFNHSAANFISGIIKPIARDTYVAFAELVDQLAVAVGELRAGSDLRKKVTHALICIASMCTRAGDQPMSSLLSEWRVWRSQGGAKDQVPFVEMLVESGRLRKELPSPEAVLEENGKFFIAAITHNAVTQRFLRHYIFMQLRMAVGKFDILLKVELFGESLFSEWVATDESGTPRIEGMTGLTDEAQQAWVSNACGELGPKDNPKLTEHCELTMAMSLIEEFTGAFFIDGIETKSLQASVNVCIRDARPLLKMLYSAMSAMFSVLVAQKTYVCNADKLVIKDLPAQKGKFGYNEALLETSTILSERINQLDVVLMSDDFKRPSVVEMPVSLAICRVQNWALLAEAYSEALKKFLAKARMNAVAAETDKLKLLCPSVSAWLSEDHFDADELKMYMRTLKVDAIKTGVTIVHNGVMVISKTLTVLKMPEAVAKEMIGSAFSEAKASIVNGKLSLAIRSCGLAIADDKPHTAQFAQSVLDSTAKLQVSLPKSLSVAVARRATRQ